MAAQEETDVEKCQHRHCKGQGVQTELWEAVRLHYEGLTLRVGLTVNSSPLVKQKQIGLGPIC